jgi:hypothetical protein
MDTRKAPMDKFEVAIKENRFDLVKNYTKLDFKRNEVLRLQMILIYFYVYIFVIEWHRFLYVGVD